MLLIRSGEVVPAPRLGMRARVHEVIAGAVLATGWGRGAGMGRVGL